MATKWPAGFSLPNFTAPLEDAELAAPLPDGATVKGFFFSRMLEELARKGHHEERRYALFKDYPLADYRALLLRSADLLHPGVPRREALRRLGQLAYPTLADTMIGRVIFGVLGDDLARVMKAAAKGYKVSLNPGSATVLASGANYAHVRLEDLHVFADCYQVGVFEGAILACKRRGEVATRVLGPSSPPTTIEMYCVWQ